MMTEPSGSIGPMAMVATSVAAASDARIMRFLPVPAKSYAKNFPRKQQTSSVCGSHHESLLGVDLKQQGTLTPFRRCPQSLQGAVRVPKATLSARCLSPIDHVQ